MTNTSARKFARALLTVSLLATSSVALSACNTTRGAGEDVSSVGHNTSRAADSVQRSISNATTASPK